MPIHEQARKHRERVSLSPQAVSVFLVVTAVVGTLLLWILPIVLTIGADGGMTAAERLKARNDVRTPLVAFALVVGAGGTLWFTYRSYLLNQRQHTTERYTRAVDQLGHDRPEVRCGGIYALERIATESPGDHRTIIYVLGAFIRQTRLGAQTGGAGDPPNPAEDVHAALRAAARLTRALREHPDGPLILDLRRARLPRVHITGLDLRDAWLHGIDLRNAVLPDARLDGAILTDARLEGADLSGASMQKTQLAGAQLDGTKLIGADLRTARHVSQDEFALAVTDHSTPPPDSFD